MMQVEVVSISVSELRDAVQQFINAANIAAAVVDVDNGFGKTVITIPLTPGGVVVGEAFKRKTDE